MTDTNIEEVEIETGEAETLPETLPEFVEPEPDPKQVLKQEYMITCDFAQAMKDLGIESTNYKTTLFKMIDNDEPLTAIDNKIAETRAKKEKTAWKENRKREFSAIDYLFIEASVEKEDGRPEKMQEYKALRKEIKEKYPKPKKS